MRILCLYNNPCARELFDWLSGQGHEIWPCSERLTARWCEEKDFDLAVSYTYRFVLDGRILKALKYNAVNLHNSFLPWNRGADPNLWSIREGTPRGVTLHYMDEALDKGYIIAQKFVTDGDEETLSGSYRNLDRAAKELFKEAFRYYEYWDSLKKKALGAGSYHSLKDGEGMKSGISSYDRKIRDWKADIG